MPESRKISRGLSLLLCLALWPAVLMAAPKDADKGPHVTVIGLMGSKAILRIDGQQQVLGKGESRDGVTLLDIVAGQARLDIKGRKLSLGMGADTGGIAARAEGASVEMVMNGLGQFITSGQINGRVVDMLVDTGANTVSMTTADARQLGIDYLMEGTPASSATAAGMVRIWLVTLKSVQIGPITVRNVQASVRDAPRLSPVLLGMSFLSQVDMRHEQNRLKMTAR